MPVRSLSVADFYAGCWHIQMQKLKLDLGFTLVKAYNQFWVSFDLSVNSSDSERKEWTQQISQVFCCFNILYVIQSIAARKKHKHETTENECSWNMYYCCCGVYWLTGGCYHFMKSSFCSLWGLKPVWNHNIGSALLDLTLDWCPSDLNSLFLLYNSFFIYIYINAYFAIFYLEVWRLQFYT